MEIYKKFFGKRLRDAIGKSGLNQSELAEKMGVEPPTVSRWVNGHDFPDDERLPELLRILNLSSDYFLTFRSEPSSSAENLIRVIGDVVAFWPSATEKERKLIETIIKRNKHKESL